MRMKRGRQMSLLLLLLFLLLLLLMVMMMMMMAHTCMGSLHWIEGGSQETLHAHSHEISQEHHDEHQLICSHVSPQ